MAFRKPKIYRGIDLLPIGNAKNVITEGAIVLEGGSLRGLYTSGVLDCLMENDINFQTTIGVSAGALNGYNYVAGNIGRSARMNLRYRHDNRYIGVRAFVKNSGIVGFDFMFNDKVADIPDFNRERFSDKSRDFIAVATNLKTAKAEYFSKNNEDDIFPALRASATLPYFSTSVKINKNPYLDGGCADRIPYKYALEKGFKNIVVIKTRDDNFRFDDNYESRFKFSKKIYLKYKTFASVLSKTDLHYNEQCDELDKLKKEGRIFVIAPSKPINIGMFEGNMERLGDLYYQGYNDCQKALVKLKNYLNKERDES